jgi:hypothetical protein
MSEKIRVEYTDGSTEELTLPPAPDRAAFDKAMGMFTALGAWDAVQSESKGDEED